MHILSILVLVHELAMMSERSAVVSYTFIFKFESQISLGTTHDTHRATLVGSHTNERWVLLLLLPAVHSCSTLAALQSSR